MRPVLLLSVIVFSWHVLEHVDSAHEAGAAGTGHITLKLEIVVHARMVFEVDAVDSYGDMIGVAVRVTLTRETVSDVVSERIQGLEQLSNSNLVHGSRGVHVTKLLRLREREEK